MGDINLINKSGIYAILDIMDNRVYVGQTQNFNNRNHMAILMKEENNNNLQKDYNNNPEKEFIHLILKYFDTVDKKKLNRYEQIFMLIFEKLGYELYNINKATKSLDKLLIEVDDECESIKNSIDIDFKERFGKTAQELITSSQNVKKEILEKYVDKRLKIALSGNTNTSKIKFDRFIYSKSRIAQIIGKTIKMEDLSNIEKGAIFYSKAGSYVGEGIEQILYRKMTNIENNENGYCLWAFANNAVCIDEVRKRCRKRESDTYVLFEYTPSNEYAGHKPTKYNFIRSKQIRSMNHQEQDELKSIRKDKNGQINSKIFEIDDEFVCTGKNETSAAVFVIEEFIFVDQLIAENWLDNYKAIQKEGTCDPRDKFYKCSTYYLEKFTSDKEIETVNSEKNRKFYFLGKLKAPYVLLVNSEN